MQLCRNSTESIALLEYCPYSCTNESFHCYHIFLQTLLLVETALLPFTAQKQEILKLLKLQFAAITDL